jgi:hypothetical protein
VTAPRRKQNGRRRPAYRPGDLWRAVRPLDDAAPIAAPRDATALLRSLGDPPLQGQGAVARHYLAAVIERAAGLATALAAAADLLVVPEED